MTAMRRRATVAVVAAAALVSGLVGCSDDSSDRDSSTTTKAPGSTTTTTATERAGTRGGKPLARYADYRSKNYDDPKHWICTAKPGDLCDDDLDVTVIEADGSTKVERDREAKDPGIDCFYVYPTISRDPTTIADWNWSPDEEGWATRNQVAPLHTDCRVFAPAYRQRTLAGITGGGTDSPDAPADPYDDVLDAWRTYMATENGGRGVVLVGHSQGTFHLTRLISEEIDPNDDARELLVSAYLAGGGVAVPEGEEVGGAFQKVPMCEKADEHGCAVSWASFRKTAPPPDGTFFGRVRGGESGQAAACVNPAALVAGKAGDEDVELDARFPARREGSIITGGTEGPDAEGKGWITGQEAASIDTPDVAVPGLLTGRCRSERGLNWLEVTVHGDPKDPRADDIPGDLTPEWGLHLVDVNLVMGDLQELVKTQSKSWLESR